MPHAQLPRVPPLLQCRETRRGSRHPAQHSWLGCQADGLCREATEVGLDGTHQQHPQPLGTPTDNPMGAQRWGGAEHMAKCEAPKTRSCCTARVPSSQPKTQAQHGAVPAHGGGAKGTLLLLPASGAAQAARYHTENSSVGCCRSIPCASALWELS